jgi:hypothetical protein
MKYFEVFTMQGERSKAHHYDEGLTKIDGSHAPIVSQRITTDSLGSPLFRQQNAQSVNCLLKMAIDISLEDDVTVSTATSATSSGEKKVHFDTSHNQEFASNEEHCLTDEVCAAAWYSEDERIRMKTNRDSELKACSQAKKDNWTESLKQLFNFCHQAPLHFTFAEEDLRAKASTVSDTDFRGLETEASAMITAARKNHATNVLTYTSRVPKRLPLDLRDRMISARSLQYSRPHMLFAQVMARVDRNVALEME